VVVGNEHLNGRADENLRQCGRSRTCPAQAVAAANSNSSARASVGADRGKALAHRVRS